ncbi:hypothetical protein KYX90_13320, partial [Enterococcus lactis]|uniref:hypothetical protein n=1 Tax=Enterococcus lactis TaxID=357441 RepID=UPI001C7CC3AC
VLGEKYAKSWRGGKMPDIRFAGSATRKQMNIAEVTVILDISDHYLPLADNEIGVTLRYRRTGEGPVYISYTTVILKDLQNEII